MRVKIVSPEGSLIDPEVRMNDIADVDASAPHDGDLLRYNENDGNPVWETSPPPISGTYNDRGDPAVYDFSKTDFSTDGAWHVLDLSSIVPAGAKLIHLKIKAQIAYNNSIIAFCKNGSVNKLNGTTLMIRHGNNEYYEEAWVACSSDRKIEYWVSNRTWVILDMLVRGWI